MREHRGREVQDRIGRILYEDWDPIGLRGVAPSDEYDSYIGGVYRLLASGASAEQVAEHLGGLERGPLGCSETTHARNMTAATKLCELDVCVYAARHYAVMPDKLHLLAGTPARIPRAGILSSTVGGRTDSAVAGSGPCVPSA
jgi:hypothetical protein